jgi:tripartite-type tricarboxylate transporter receptor subunit TctC
LRCYKAGKHKDNEGEGTMTRASFLVALLAAGTIAAGASAQTYPTRQIQLVVPFPAGGNTDLMARALQPELAKALG